MRPQAEIDAELLKEATQHIGEQRQRIQRLEDALKVADGTISALENCGVRSPCAQCDAHIRHGHKIARAALSEKSAGSYSQATGET